MNYVCKRLKSYCKACYYLLTHPNNTYHYLSTLRKSDGLIFLFLFIIETLPTLLSTLVESIVDPSLPLGILESGAAIYNLAIYPFYVALAYLLWHAFSYILWSMLEYLGATVD